MEIVAPTICLVAACGIGLVLWALLKRIDRGGRGGADGPWLG